MNSRNHQRMARTVEGYPPQALAVVERLHAQFPDAGVSLGPADSAFSAPAAFWAAGGTGIEQSLAYQDFFAIGMTDRIRAAHLIAFYSRQLSVVLGALYLGAGLQAQIAGLRFEEWTRLHQDREVAGKRYHFRLGVAEGPQHAEGISAFERGFTAHLAPVIAVLKKRTGLSSGAQWRLAADSLAGAFLEIGRAIGDEARGMAEALAIVKRRGSRLFSEEALLRGDLRGRSGKRRATVAPISDPLRLLPLLPNGGWQLLRYLRPAGAGRSPRAAGRASHAKRRGLNPAVVCSGAHGGRDRPDQFALAKRSLMKPETTPSTIQKASVVASAATANSAPSTAGTLLVISTGCGAP